MKKPPLKKDPGKKDQTKQVGKEQDKKAKSTTSRIKRVRRKAREIAMQTLYQYDWGELSQEEALSLDWLEREAEDASKEFARLLIRGSIENQAKIDALIKKYSAHWSFDRIPRVELAILRFSIYSLLSLPEIPPIVTIDEAIEISKLYSGEDAWRYINGLLDAVYNQEINAGKKTDIP